MLSPTSSAWASEVIVAQRCGRPPAPKWRAKSRGEALASFGQHVDPFEGCERYRGHRPAHLACRPWGDRGDVRRRPLHDRRRADEGRHGCRRGKRLRSSQNTARKPCSFHPTATSGSPAAGKMRCASRLDGSFRAAVCALLPLLLRSRSLGWRRHGVCARCRADASDLRYHDIGSYANEDESVQRGELVPEYIAVRLLGYVTHRPAATGACAGVLRRFGATAHMLVADGTWQHFDAAA
jgi:hypothetical protein